MVDDVPSSARAKHPLDAGGVRTPSTDAHGVSPADCARWKFPGERRRTSTIGKTGRSAIDAALQGHVKEHLGARIGYTALKFGDDVTSSTTRAETTPRVQAGRSNAAAIEAPTNAPKRAAPQPRRSTNSSKNSGALNVHSTSVACATETPARR